MDCLFKTPYAHAIGLPGEPTKMYEDRKFMDRLKHTMKIADTHAANYDAIYLTGGYGTMFDFPINRPLAKLITRFYESGKIVSAVRHGPSGLLNVTLSNGEPLIKNKNVTGLSWNEEKLAKRDEAAPFTLEKELQKPSLKQWLIN